MRGVTVLDITIFLSPYIGKLCLKNIIFLDKGQRSGKVMQDGDIFAYTLSMGFRISLISVFSVFCAKSRCFGRKKILYIFFCESRAKSVFKLYYRTKSWTVFPRPSPPPPLHIKYSKRSLMLNNIFAIFGSLNLIYGKRNFLAEIRIPITLLNRYSFA